MKNRSKESHDDTMYNVHDLEFWSEDIPFNQPLINCRTKAWWQSHLSNWDLDFHGPSMAEYGYTYKNFFKGIHGYKK